MKPQIMGAHLLISEFDLTGCNYEFICHLAPEHQNEWSIYILHIPVNNLLLSEHFITL